MGKNIVLESSQISFEDLKKRQSVRATFKLPEKIIDLLVIIANQLGIKQKSLLDQLVEDTALLNHLVPDEEYLAENQVMRRHKTYVLSRSSLRSLNSVAERRRVPRDFLVEGSIRRLLPIVESELERHGNRKIIQKEMVQVQKQSEDLLAKAEQLLGKNDVLHEMMERQLRLSQKNLEMVNAIVEKGAPMEKW